MCKINAHNKHIEKLELMWINFGKDISSLDDLSLNVFEIVEIDNCEPVLLCDKNNVRARHDEKKINKQYRYSTWLDVDISHALNIRITTVLF